MLTNITGSRLFYCIVFILLLISSAKTTMGQPDRIVLQDEAINVRPAGFYISGVTDERVVKGAFASIMVASAKSGSELHPADLDGGLLPAVRKFIYRNFSRDTLLRPVLLTLKSVSLKEVSQPDHRVDGHVNLSFSFYLLKANGDKVYLSDYTGSARYNRDISRTENIEPACRRVLVNGLLFVNEWMNVQVKSNIKLANRVKIGFTDYTEKPEGDSIYYRPERPLTWDDFQGKIPVSRYAAQVFPGFGYDEKTAFSDGVISVQLLLKVYLPKSAAWVRPGERNSYALNHEQRHFDIAKIAALYFEQSISAAKLQVDNYEATINSLYLEAYREMSRMQIQYDDETNHGTGNISQKKWNLKIEDELARLGVKGKD
ncbi:MAG TPA: DUF922 domain-containing protein [Mucilaginibacter sp.]|nr:DUF922 domain-containing protein [Mucilaginibacter sp.]